MQSAFQNVFTKSLPNKGRIPILSGKKFTVYKNTVAAIIENVAGRGPQLLNRELLVKRLDGSRN
jgi:hypothetical protein